MERLDNTTEAARTEPSRPGVGVREPASSTGFTASGRTHILDCEIDRVDLEQATGICERAIVSRSPVQHMAINVAKLMAMRSDPELRDSVAQCELITADGQPVVWASRLLADPLPCRVAGIDLMHSVLARAALSGYRIYILGAQPDTLERAVVRLRQMYPGLRIAGYRDGYYDDEAELDVAQTIAAKRPDILLVAMSSPRKEYFVARHRERMQVPFIMGVGGAIDVVAGVTRRAPAVLQRLGLEWLFRLLQEPRRLAKRYFKTNRQFLLLLGRETAKRALRRRRVHTAEGATASPAKPSRRTGSWTTPTRLVSSSTANHADDSNGSRFPQR